VTTGFGHDLDDAAAAILAAAINAARALGHERCGTEHLLLGAARLPELDEHRTLVLFGLGYPVVELMVEHLGARVRSAPPDPLPLTDRAIAALATPRADGSGPTGWPELLHGALRDDRSGASEVVRRLGKDLAWLRTALHQQTRHLTREQMRAESDELTAASRAARAPWTGPDPDAPRVEVPLPAPTDAHGVVEIARHEDTTARVAGLFAAADGFGFTLLLDGRDWERSPEFERYDPTRATQDERDIVAITLHFADGSTVDNSYRHAYGYDVTDPPTGHTLAVATHGWSTSGHAASAHAELWSWPLPPRGPITIHIEWPARSITGAVRISGDEILDRAARSTIDTVERFGVVATWLPPEFVLDRSGPGGASVHVVRLSVDGEPPDPPPPPPPTVVHSATWTGPPTVLGEGQLEFPRITLTAVRSSSPTPLPPGTTERLGGHDMTVHAGGPTHVAGWQQDDIHVRVVGHAIAIDDFRMFLAHLRQPD
jgi:hypothetical protein